MNDDQVEILARAAGNVDGGCIYCVTGITVALAMALPDHDWVKLVGKHLETNRVYDTQRLLREVDNAMSHDED